MLEGYTPQSVNLAAQVPYTVTLTYEGVTKTQTATLTVGQTTYLNFDFTSVTPPPTGKTVFARTIGPFGIPLSLLKVLKKMRNRLVSVEVHKKLHPLI